MDLKECEEKGFIKKTTPNKELIKSLKEMSDIKELAVKRSQSDKETISAYVSLAYDSLREVLEAFCIKLGYKVTNHVCIGELLKKLTKDFNYAEFDRLRYIRNSINYYGEKIEYEQGKEIIEKILRFKNEIIKKI